MNMIYIFMIKIALNLKKVQNNNKNLQTFIKQSKK